MGDQRKVDDLMTQMTAEANAAGGSTPEPKKQKSNSAPAEKVVVAPSKHGVFGSEPEPKWNSVREALLDRQKQTQKRMRISEDLMMTYLYREISISYYELWRKESNLYFRNLCILKRRLASLK